MPKVSSSRAPRKSSASENDAYTPPSRGARKPDLKTRRRVSVISVSSGDDTGGCPSVAPAQNHNLSRVPLGASVGFGAPNTNRTKETVDGAVSAPARVSSSEVIVVSGVELRPTIAFDTFWRFAAERKAIDDRRRAGEPAPWTDDPILDRYFFCNTYRVLDKLCQYLIREVIEKGPQDPVEVVFRVVLFNLFTKISTWELLATSLGPLTYKTYDRLAYQRVLATAVAGGMTLYTGAFIKPAPRFYDYKENYMNHLCLLEVLMENQLPYKLLGAPHMADVYEYIISFPSMGDFTAYQLILNLSYTNVLNFHRDDFVIAGPGSLSGLKKLFGRSFEQGAGAVPYFAVDVMRYLVQSQEYHFKRLGLKFSKLGPKRLGMDVSDVEHTLCEVDKYCRVKHPQLKGKRTHLHRNFSAAGAASQLGKAIIPKAWRHPARVTPRIRAEKTLVVEKRYTIDKIADHKDGPDGPLYLVYWVGYAAKDATWEPEVLLLADAPPALREYKAQKGL
ncbi:hypothetical protein B0H34DRAFT_676883 [Crassisporium funariophilum]|nr:hypothetical protein B0H34DRAFT_676883 [Crassisporium funariophilum]